MNGKLPMPVFISISIVLILLFGFLLTWVAFTQSAKYQKSHETEYPPYYSSSPAYRSSIEEEETWLQHIQRQESTLQQQARWDLNQTGRNTQDQLDNLQLQRDILKTQKSSF